MPLVLMAGYHSVTSIFCWVSQVLYNHSQTNLFAYIYFSLQKHNNIRVIINILDDI